MQQVVRIATIAAVLMSAGLGAQGRNFSGTWTVDTEKTMAAGGGGGARGSSAGGAMVVRRVDDTGAVATGGVMATGGGRGGGGGGGEVVARGGGAGGAIVVTGTTVTVDAKSFTITQGQTTTAYALDGSATDVSNQARKATAKATWQGDKIAIETTAEGPNGPVVTHATWYLEGDSLVRENTSTGPDGTPVVRKTYYKRG
jgi:hypothetical protein